MTTLSFPFPTASRTVLAPLTTVFTPAATCSSYVANGILAPTVDYWQAQACSDGAPVDALPCWPPALVQTSIPLHGRGFYSPGLSCPAGYTSACTAAQSTNGSPSPLALGTSFVFQYPLTAGETAIGCCPGLVKTRECTNMPNILQRFDLRIWDRPKFHMADMYVHRNERASR